MRNKNCDNCLFYSECLDLIASRFSLIYTSSILISILLSLILLPDWITIQSLKWTLGIIALILAIIPLIFKEKIEKVHGYTALAMEFKNLEQDFQNEGNSKINFENLKKLTTKLSDFPVDRYTKWRMKK